MRYEPAIVPLLREATKLRAGELVWQEAVGGWKLTCGNARVPHYAFGRTPLEALKDLLRFLRIISR